HPCPGARRRNVRGDVELGSRDTKPGRCPATPEMAVVRRRGVVVPLRLLVFGRDLTPGSGRMETSPTITVAIISTMCAVAPCHSDGDSLQRKATLSQDLYADVEDEVRYGATTSILPRLATPSAR